MVWIFCVQHRNNQPTQPQGPSLGSILGGTVQPTASGNTPQSLEQLLERQWEQGSQFLMEQAQHFDSECHFIHSDLDSFSKWYNYISIFYSCIVAIMFVSTAIGKCTIGRPCKQFDCTKGPFAGSQCPFGHTVEPNVQWTTTGTRLAFWNIYIYMWPTHKHTNQIIKKWTQKVRHFKPTTTKYHLPWHLTTNYSSFIQSFEWPDWHIHKATGWESEWHRLSTQSTTSNEC